MNLSEPLYLTIIQREKEIVVDFSQQFRRDNDGLERESFHWHLNGSNWDKTGITNGTFGDTSIWLPFMEETRGIKIVREKHPGYLTQVSKNLGYLQKIKSDIFPEIFEFHETTVNGCPCITILMEKVEPRKQPILDGTESWLPHQDRIFVQNELSVPLSVLSHCIEEFVKYQLIPDLSWHKGSNLIGSKIVDLQDIAYAPEKYILQNNAGRTKDEMIALHQNALERYQKWINLPDSGGLPKWKNKYYQPIFFDTPEGPLGVPGYSSNGKIYDSYLKMQFIPFDAPAVKSSNVLELGSCMGLFPLIAAQTCQHATGVEITWEDYKLATEIQEITQQKNVTFINQDAIGFVANDTQNYGLIILSSVVHQIFPNFQGADPFMKSLLSRCHYMLFENTQNHSKMNIPLEQTYEKFVSYCQGNEDRVRLCTVYDAYSEGYRSIWILYGQLASV